MNMKRVATREGNVALSSYINKGVGEAGYTCCSLPSVAVLYVQVMTIPEGRTKSALVVDVIVVL